MRLIDADALIKELDRKHYSMASRKQIYSQPTIDAVPVVRCKDCKYSMPNDGVLVVGAMYCTQTLDAGDKFTPVWDVDYCSNGERKDLSLEKTIDKTSNNEEVQE